MKKILFLLFTALLFFSKTGDVISAEKNYVGSKACAECHEEEYKTFTTYAKKAHSFKAIEKMRDGLSETELRQCFKCHTTGYGKPGGFVNESQTPEMKNTGCEVCHGPGSVHIETEEISDIINSENMDMRLCETCHSSEIVSAFNFKPMLHGGAH